MMGNTRAWVLTLACGASVAITGCSSDGDSGARGSGADAGAAAATGDAAASGGSSSGGRTSTGGASTGGASAGGATTGAGGASGGAGGTLGGSGGTSGVDGGTADSGPGAGNADAGTGGATTDASASPDAASGGATGAGGATGSTDAGYAPFCPGVGCVNGDNCCNPGCSKLTDDDCSNICGDKQIAHNEGCDDGNAVTETCTYGAYSCQVCDKDCLSVPGATSRCGDGRVDPTNGELCDSSTCPGACADFDVCTTDVLTGTSCQTACTHTAIAACVAGDGCCPPGCTTGTDADCACAPTGPEIADNGLDDDCVGGDLTATGGAGVYVAKSGNDASAGTKAAPKLTVSAAVTLAATSGGSVFVAEGVYTENVTTRVSIFGGYEATGWTRSLATHATEIHAIGSSPALSVPRSAAKAVVLDGLRAYGGGNSWSCGAIDVEGAGIVALVSRVYVDGGSCDNGYGVEALYGAQVRVVNSIVLGGSGYHTSVAVQAEYEKARLEAFHSLVRARPSQFSYAAQAEYDADLLLVNDIVDGPSGVDLEYGGRAALYGDDVYHAGGTCLVRAGGCITTAAAVNTCTFTGCQGAASNFSADPLLTGSGAAERLGAGSPCIDAGVDPSTYGVKVPLDIDGDARPQGAKPDVGHDEVVP